MRPARDKDELRARMKTLTPGQWICPCGATKMGSGTNKSWGDYCPYCHNIPSSVAWFKGTQEKDRAINRNKSNQKSKKKQCECCGVTFTAKRSDAKFCTDACKQEAYRNRKGKK